MGLFLFLLMSPLPYFVFYLCRNSYLPMGCFFPQILGLSPTVIVVFSVALLAGKTSSVDPYFNRCKPQRCGAEGPNISYPFWIDGAQPSYCGYPGFNLRCEDASPVLTISENDFLIREILYENQTVLLVDKNFSSDPCPRSVRNLTIDRTPFRFLPNQIELYFIKCNPHYRPSDGSNFFPIPCISESSYATFDGRVPTNVLDFWDSCELWVKVPVMVDEVPAGGELNFTKLFDLGFLLNWTAQSCTDCLKSGGQCGYNWTESEFQCFCSDRPHKVKCQGSNKTKKIIIGVCSGLGGFLVACFLCLVGRRHLRWRRLATTTSSLLPQDVSPDPSSKHHDLEKCNSTLYTHIFSYKELQEATNNFDSSRELGDGGFGTVYFGKLCDGRPVAVKRLYENNYRRVEQFMNEVKILSTLRHPSLVTLYGCTSRRSRELLLVYEYIPNGTVADHLHGDRAENSALEWPIRMSIAIETAEALAYLHAVDPPIIHRDVKTNNILLDNNFRVKVADFGLSRLFPTDVTHVSTTPQGTPGYVDPDYHKCYQLTDKSDVYSFGVVLIELISSMPAVDITRHRHEINLAYMAVNKIHSGALHELVDKNLGFEGDPSVRRMITVLAELAYRCLQEEKEVRPSMEEVVEVLKGIEKAKYEMEQKGKTGTDEIDNLDDDVGLLKKIPPPSPNSVMENWGSKSTTPNTSS